MNSSMTSVIITPAAKILFAMTLKAVSFHKKEYLLLVLPVPSIIQT
jgi:hypothetical protein